MCFLSLPFLETRNRLKYWIQFDTALVGWRRVGSRAGEEGQGACIIQLASSQLKIRVVSRLLPWHGHF